MAPKKRNNIETDTQSFTFSWIKDDEDSHERTIEVFRKEGGQKLLEIDGDWYDCAAYGCNVVGVMDSVDASAGELAWQLYQNSCVSRKKYTPSFLYYFEHIREEDEGAYKSLTPEQLKEITFGVFSLMRGSLKEYERRSEILFAFLGNESVCPLDETLKELFIKTDFAVFRCVKGITCSESAYIAVFSSWAENDNNYLTQQKETEYYPEEIDPNEEESEDDKYWSEASAIKDDVTMRIQDLDTYLSELLKKEKRVDRYCYGANAARKIYNLINDTLITPNNDEEVTLYEFLDASQIALTCLALKDEEPVIEEFFWILQDHYGMTVFDTDDIPGLPPSGLLE